MKKSAVIMIMIFLIMAAISVPKTNAQDKSKEDQAKELKILKDIEQQKKELADQKKAKHEAEADDKYQESENSADSTDYQVDADKWKRAGEDYARQFNKAMANFNPRARRNFNFKEPFVMTPDMAMNFDDHDSESTTWDYSRSLKENSFSRDFSFDVEKSAKTVVMTIMGDCKEGDVRIKIKMPNGKSYSDVVIDEAGNLNWRKSFTINDDENQDKTGEWKFSIISEKATGFFKISLQTY